jgi:hypothetical protein
MKNVDAMYKFSPLNQCFGETKITHLNDNLGRRHKQSILTKGSRCISIDSEIAELIKYLWDNGIDTLNSCQNLADKDNIWIVFEDNELLKFKELIKNIKINKLDISEVNNKKHIIFPKSEYNMLMSCLT